MHVPGRAAGALSDVDGGMAARGLSLAYDAVDLPPAGDRAWQGASLPQLFATWCGRLGAEPLIHRHITAVNAHGVRLDTRAARAGAARVAAAVQGVAASANRFDVPLAMLERDDDLIEMIARTTGLRLGSLSRRSVERYVAASQAPPLAELLRLRDEHRALVAIERMTRRIALAPDIVRPLLVGNGCITGRTSPDTGNAAALNLQGMPREKAAGVSVRALLVPPRAGFYFCAADLSQIEARLVAWLCNETELLRMFEVGEDVYATVGRHVAPQLPEHASRRLGKEAVLGLSYGMGATTFGDRVRIAAPTISHDDIRGAHEAYHHRFPGIVATRARWFEAVRRALETISTVQAGAVTFQACIDLGQLTIVVWLPTGRPLFYRSVRRGDRSFWASHALFGQQGRENDVNFPDGIFRRELTEVRLFENIVQAVARDILFHQIVALETAGMEVAFSVHDEIVCVVPECRCLHLGGGHDARCSWRASQRMLVEVML